jgi:hypothetical protein
MGWCGLTGGDGVEAVGVGGLSEAGEDFAGVAAGGDEYCVAGEG